MQVLTLRLPPKGLQASSSKMSSGDDTFKWYCHLDSIKLKLNETSRMILKNMKQDNPRTRMPPPPPPPSPSPHLPHLDPLRHPSPLLPPPGTPFGTVPQRPCHRVLARTWAETAGEHTPGPQTPTVKREPFAPHSGKMLMPFDFNLHSSAQHLCCIFTSEQSRVAMRTVLHLHPVKHRPYGIYGTHLILKITSKYRLQLSISIASV